MKERKTDERLTRNSRLDAVGQIGRQTDCRILADENPIQ